MYISPKSFDWLAFCKQAGIPFADTGASTAKGNIYIHCPFCGAADKSQHMGLSLTVKTPYWGCWRDASHRGATPQRLLVGLLACSWEEATKIVDEHGAGVSAEDHDALLELLPNVRFPGTTLPVVLERKKKGLVLPSEFKRLTRASEYALSFKHYLSDRGFDDPERLAERFDLRYCLRGPFGGRLIIPVYHDERLVSWTARDVTGKAKIRYKTLGTDPESCKMTGYGPALTNLADTVFNFDRALRKAGKAKTLAVCEGPFDAIKLDWLGRSSGVSAVAVFGTPKRTQFLELVSLAEQGYGKVVVALDADALGNALRLVDMLKSLLHCEVQRMVLPKGVKDPGDLTARQFESVFSS